jgi:hypothetical protein
MVKKASWTREKDGDQQAMFDARILATENILGKFDTWSESQITREVNVLVNISLKSIKQNFFVEII